ncbi:MAG: DUF362 domain-containing protein, partial [Victivallales bacterium]|nr:DUF362 domain-containing protein [Victivallales bacterium]
MAEVIMERRDFLKSSLAVGLLSGTGLPLLAAPAAAPVKYDLVAVRNGEPDEMFRRGMAAYGGIGRFVKPGQTVLVKPNIGWDKPPDLAANTNPVLVRAIVEECVRAGAEVVAFDHTCNNWKFCYRNSGIAAAVEAGGGTMHPGHDQRHYREVKLPGAVNLKTAQVHELLLSCDVFINVPVLKNHGGAKLTCAMKNLMGVVWDRRFYHRNDLGRCIADFLTYRKPDLNVVDAYRIMKTNGPRGIGPGDVELKKQLLLSSDILAIDVAAARIIGYDPESISYLRA